MRHLADPNVDHRPRPGVATLLLLAAAFATSSALCAATLVVAPGEVVVAANGRCSLREAIHNANANGQVDNRDCPAGTAGLDTVQLAAGSTYTLPDADPSDLDSGLPQVTSEIVFEGGGATIERDPNLTCTLDGARIDNEEFKIFRVESGGDLTLRNLTLQNGCADGSKGVAKDGGAIYIKNGTLALDHVHVTGNQAYNLSGALDTKNSTITITDSTFDFNYSAGAAGAIGNGDGTTLTLTGSVVAHNSAGSGAGGIGDYGTLRIFDSTISDNTEMGLNPQGGGGGIGCIGGSLHLERSTVSGNSSMGPLGGGGIGLAFTEAVIVNSTISGNSAAGDLGGGGVLDGSASLELVASTVVGNSASGAAGGGGVSIQGLYDMAPAGELDTKSSIVADNPVGGDCASAPGGGTFAGAGVDFDSDGTCADLDPAFTQETSAALHLGTLASNGGPTRTIALLAGSVAIDAASDCKDLAGVTLATDQRGVPRPLDGDASGTAACDVGAYEAEPAVVAVPVLTPAALWLFASLLGAAALLWLRQR